MATWLQENVKIFFLSKHFFSTSNLILTMSHEHVCASCLQNLKIDDFTFIAVKGSIFPFLTQGSGHPNPLLPGRVFVYLVTVAAATASKDHEGVFMFNSCCIYCRMQECNVMYVES